MTNTDSPKRKFLTALNQMEEAATLMLANGALARIKFGWFVATLAKMRNALTEDMIAEARARDIKARGDVHAIFRDIKIALGHRGDFGAWLPLEPSQIKHLALLCKVESIWVESSFDDAFFEFKNMKEKK